METNEQVVFSDQQKTVIESLIADRLSQAKAELALSEASLEAVKTEARRRLAAASGAPNDLSTDAYLTAERAKSSKDDADRIELEKYFSAKPGSGTNANRLLKENPELYRKLRERAGELRMLPESPRARVHGGGQPLFDPKGR